MAAQKASLCRINWSGLLALLVFSSSVMAQAPVSRGKPASADDHKVDISDLENKYWAPKDTDFSVVQNRAFTKEKRFFLTPQFGRPINDRWNEGNLYGLTGNYFWSERMGVQVSWLKGTLKDNEAVTALVEMAQNASGVTPNRGRFQSYYGIGLNVVPFYAKMSFWGKKILYFDMAITPHVGMTQYEQVLQDVGNRSKSAVTFGLDITQFFFFTNYFAIRADLKNHWRPEEIAAFRGANGAVTGQKVKDQTTQDTMFLLGLTFFY